MSIKIFSFQKDEELLVEWLEHHGNIFGFNNIYIIDHNSKSKTLNIYMKYVKLGLNLNFYYGDFFNKNVELTNIMLNHKHDSEFLIPIDGDEFICIKTDNGIIKDKNTIINNILTYKNVIGKFKFKTYFNLLERLECNNIYNECIYFREDGNLLERLKTFYPSKYFVNTDQGNHYGLISTNDDNLIKTDLVLLHYAFKSYSSYVNKIKRGVDAYKHNSETGSHWFVDYERYNNGTLLEHFIKYYMFNEFDSNYIKIEK